jgi:hypothetical protein
MPHLSRKAKEGKYFPEIKSSNAEKQKRKIGGVKKHGSGYASDSLENPNFIIVT